MTGKLGKKVLPDKLSHTATVQPQSCAMGAGGLSHFIPGIFSIILWENIHCEKASPSCKLQGIAVTVIYYVDFMDHLYKLQWNLSPNCGLK